MWRAIATDGMERPYHSMNRNVESHISNLFPASNDLITFLYGQCCSCVLETLIYFDPQLCHKSISLT